MGLFRFVAQLIFIIDVMFFLLLGLSLLYLEPGTSSYYVALVTLVPTTLTFVAAVAVIRTGWEPF